MALNILLIIRFLFCFVPVKEGVPSSIYDFKVTAAGGGTIDFSQFRGKKILIFNAPVNADHNRQYAEMEALYQKYKGSLVIVGILSPDFSIPPGYGKETYQGAKNYNVTFPMVAESIARGNDMSPIFKWLTDKNYNRYKDTEIKWDFQKYLINENGELVEQFDPKVRPADQRLTSSIELK